MEVTNTSGAKNGASGVMDRVKEGATAQLSSQKNRATDGLGSLAEAVRKTSQPLRENNQDTIARYVEQAADQIERVSTRLRERDVSELMQDAQRLARRQPALFIGGAFALGVLAARFLKSSAGDQRHGDWRRSETAYGSAGGRTPALASGYSGQTGQGGGSRYGGGL